MISKNNTPWVGIKAPDKLSDDPWFPVPSFLKDRYAAEQRYNVGCDPITGDKTVKESANIHEEMYQEAIRYHTTTDGTWESGVG